MTNLFRGPITGPKFAAIFSSFFLVIIAVNIGLAVSAVRTFPGLEVKNSYVASQSFDAERAAQEALGWQAEVTVAGGELVLGLRDDQGRPAEVTQVSALFGRATNAADDQRPELTFDGEVWRAPVVADGGNWLLRLEATAPDGTVFRQRLNVHVGAEG